VGSRFAIQRLSGVSDAASAAVAARASASRSPKARAIVGFTPLADASLSLSSPRSVPASADSAGYYLTSATKTLPAMTSGIPFVNSWTLFLIQFDAISLAASASSAVSNWPPSSTGAGVEAAIYEGSRPRRFSLKCPGAFEFILGCLTRGEAPVKPQPQLCIHGELKARFNRLKSLVSPRSSAG
jgi:hypothetical protein